LNGAPDTVNVINSIYIELITSQVFAEQLKPAKKIISKITNVYRKFFDSSNPLLNLGASSINLGVEFWVKHIWKKDKKRIVLLLDDLERISDTIDITDLLGLIHTNFILNDVKVIYIADDSKINQSGKFNTEKEKYIYRTVSFYNDRYSIFKSFLESKNIFSDNFMIDLQEVFSEEQINLRSVKFCLDCYVELEKFYKDLPPNEYNSIDFLFYTICRVGKFYQQENIQKNELIKALNPLNSTEPSKKIYKDFVENYGTRIVNYNFIFDLICDGIFIDKDVSDALKKINPNEDTLSKLYNIQDMETDEVIEILKKIKENIEAKKYSIRNYGVLMKLFVFNAEKFNITTEEEMLPLISKSIFSKENNAELQKMFEYWVRDEFSRPKKANNMFEQELISKFNEFSDNKIKNSVEIFFQKIEACNADIFSNTLEFREIFTLLIQMNYVDKILNLKNKSIRFFAYFIDSTICNVSNANEFYTREIPALETFNKACAEKQEAIRKEDILKDDALKYLEKTLNNAITQIKRTENRL